ncbi:MAG TPA: hypothetical protein VLS89_17170 [Candidatus Nanopelagicales bacterium]|nr:hypothetical protein [Candidatus Nanopelagicales bacterium]
MAQGLMPAVPIGPSRWVETQVTAIIERRADKALELDVAGRRRWLQVEFAVAPGRAVFYRMFEYLSLLLVAQRAAVAGAVASADPPAVATPHLAPDLSSDIVEDTPAAPIEGVLIILSGRKQPWPACGRYRTSPPDAPFSGQHFRIEAVYQRSVEELRARPGSFWLVFTCLAVNANVENMLDVIQEIRRREPDPTDRAELYLTFLHLAALDPWGHNLAMPIQTMLQQLDLAEALKTRPFSEVFASLTEDARELGLKEGMQEGLKQGVQEGLKQGVQEGLQEGLKQGVQEGLKEGLKQGVQEGRAQVIETMLRKQLARQLQRQPTPAEQQRLAERARTLTDPELDELLSGAVPGSLIPWLLGSDAE